MNYRQTRNYENLEKRIYDGVGAFDIPQLEPAQFNEKCEFISFSQALAQRRSSNGSLFVEEKGGELNGIN